MGAGMKRKLHDDPTAEDLQVMLEDHFKRIALTGEGILTCPWCGQINMDDAEPCCEPLKRGIDRMGERKFESFVRQANDVRDTEIHGVKRKKNYIDCPYCYGKLKINKTMSADPTEWNRPNVHPWCCDMSHAAARAYMEGLGYQVIKHDLARIEEGLSRKVVVN